MTPHFLRVARALAGVAMVGTVSCSMRGAPDAIELNDTAVSTCTPSTVGTLVARGDSGHCPSDMPASGAACSSAAACTWSFGCCQELRCSCDGAHWTCANECTCCEG